MEEEQGKEKKKIINRTWDMEEEQGKEKKKIMNRTWGRGTGERDKEGYE